MLVKKRLQRNSNWGMTALRASLQTRTHIAAVDLGYRPFEPQGQQECLCYLGVYLRRDDDIFATCYGVLPAAGYHDSR